METYISQQPKPYRAEIGIKIAMTIFYNHVMGNINKLTFLFLKYLRKLEI